MLYFIRKRALLCIVVMCTSRLKLNSKFALIMDDERFYEIVNRGGYKRIAQFLKK